jgi:hypothetical protein
MQGWQVVTSGGDKVGRVAEVTEHFLIVEHGHIHKTKHAVPMTFVHPREADEVVCLGVPKDMIDESPKVNGEGFDEQKVAEYYGLVGDVHDASTEGEGETEWDDPRYGSDRDAEAAGRMSADRLRANVRGHKRHERFPPSPSFLGDRKRNNARDR